MWGGSAHRASNQEAKGVAHKIVKSVANGLEVIEDENGGPITHKEVDQVASSSTVNHVQEAHGRIKLGLMSSNGGLAERR